MMKLRYITAILSVILCQLMVSCSSENEIPLPELNEGITFHIDMPKPSTVRTDTEGGVNFENDVHSLWAFIATDDTENSGFIIAKKCVLRTNTSSQYFIPVSESQKTQLTGTKKTYFVANYDFDSNNLPQNIAELKSRIINRNLDELSAKGIVMVGKKDISYNYPSNKDLGTIQLERRLVKIRVLQPNFKVEGYHLTQEPIQMTLLNYPVDMFIDKLENTDTPFQGSDNQIYKKVEREKCEFYNYFQDWTNNPAKAPTLKIKVQIQKDGSNETFWNYYLVPIVPTQKMLLPNYIYEITVALNRLGATEEGMPVTITNSSVIIKPWQFKETPVDIVNAKFLYFFEHGHSGVYDLTNTEAHLKFATSSEIKTCEITCYYSHYNPVSTNEETFSIGIGEEGYPTEITWDNGEVSFKVKSITKCYYKYIEIKLTNEQGQTDGVTLRQVPGTLIQEWQSQTYYGNDLHIRTLNMPIAEIPVRRVWGDGSTKKVGNPEMFKIYLGYPNTSMRHIYWWGDPHQGKYGPYLMTNIDEVTSHMLSPSFYLQSQNYGTYGLEWKQYDYSKIGILYTNGNYKDKAYNVIPKSLNYLYIYYDDKPEDAIQHGMRVGVQERTETVKNPGSNIKLTNWRLPTVAELIYLWWIKYRTTYGGNTVLRDGNYWASNGVSVGFWDDSYVYINDFRTPYQRENGVIDQYQYKILDKTGLGFNQAYCLYVSDYTAMQDEEDNAHK